MATATATRSVNLGPTTLGTIYATPTGLKVGKGKVQDPGVVLGELSKREARKVRKAARQAGFNQHAGAVREVRRRRVTA